MTRCTRFSPLVLSLSCAMTGCIPLAAGTTERGSSQSSGQKELTSTGATPYHGLIQYRAKDAKPAIIKPDLISGAEALIAPGTKVIGVFLGGEARAYPLFILNNHQVVNDQIGDVPISASW